MADIIKISNALLPSEPQSGRVAPDSWYAKRESSSSDGPTLDMDMKIRVVAEHPDGGYIYEECGTTAPVELKHMPIDGLRSWQLLPTPLTMGRLEEKIRGLRNGGDSEELDGIFLEALTTIAVYSLDNKGSVSLAKAVLECTKSK
jgi:hypothetical protein